MLFAFGPDSIAAYSAAVSLAGMGMIAVYTKFREVRRDQTTKDREAVSHDMVADLEACRAQINRMVAELEETRSRLASCESRSEALSQQVIEMARLIRR